jgi:hypothetical protein
VSSLGGMNKLPNPFSLYDFLGYLIPGMLLALGLLAAANLNVFADKPIETINQALSQISVELSLVGLVVCYLIGQITSYVSSMTIEKYLNWSVGYPSKYLLKIGGGRFWRVSTHGWEKLIDLAIRAILYLLILPVVIMDLVFGVLFKFRRTLAKELDDQLITIIKEKTSELVRSSFRNSYEQASDADFFRIYYHYAMEKCPNHYGKFQNYVALYGFTRTVTLIFVALFWFNLIQAITCSVVMSICIWTLPALVILCYIMYASFSKFYRKFSLEVLMAVTANYETK